MRQLGEVYQYLIYLKGIRSTLQNGIRTLSRPEENRIGSAE